MVDLRGNKFVYVDKDIDIRGIALRNKQAGDILALEECELLGKDTSRMKRMEHVLYR